MPDLTIVSLAHIAELAHYLDAKPAQRKSYGA